MKKAVSIAISILFLTVLPAFPDSENQIRESSLEIHIQNLLNSLYLTDEQVQFILARARELERIKKEESYQAEEYLKTLEGIKDDLKEDNFVTEEKREEFEMKKRPIVELRKQYTEKSTQFSKEIKEKLTSIQQQIIEDYNPCIIPPKGPSRIGQSEASDLVQDQLERIYDMPQEIYDQRKEQIVARIIERRKEHFLGGSQIPIQETEDNETSKKALEFLDNARSLDEIEFTANKEKLAKEFKELFRHSENKPDILTKIRRFLLNPEAIPLLEEVAG